MMNDFSYAYYLDLVKTISQRIPLVDYANINSTQEQFFILRHDVEFSVEKAYELARIEHDILGISSSYFFQCRNYAYNPLAFKNVRLIKKIYTMGHKIGLHANLSGVPATADRAGFIKDDVTLLQQGLGIPIDRFSFHRPSQQLLQSNLHIAGLINTYDRKYFQFFAKNKPKNQAIYYFSDSEHRWKYGNPRDILEKPIKKMQLLIHPYSWSKRGLTNDQNFKHLVKEKYGLMKKAMNAECHNFPPELLDHDDL